MLKFFSFLLAMCVFLTSTSALACTGIMLKGADGTSVRSRTLEWGEFDLFPQLEVVPRNHQFASEKMPDGKAGLSWKNRYGFVGITLLKKEAFLEAINEKGLNGGLFYHPGYAEYAKYDPAQAADSLAPTDLVGYIISQCATLDEVRAAFKKIHVAPVVEPALGFPAPVHFIFSDPQGKAIVVEFIGKKTIIVDAPLGVITNAPSYYWHETNLRNYVNLSAVAVPTKKLDGKTFAPMGAGSGMIGLPGDFTPPSRFVRAVAFSQSARKTTGGFDTVRESFRILDNFNVPLDAAENSGDKANKKSDHMYSATQITTSVDTKNMVLYYHTQYDRRVRKVDMKKLDFSKNPDKIIVRPTDPKQEEDILDVTP